jgi:GNAT superfamily N-acetyltransferase
MKDCRIIDTNAGNIGTCSLCGNKSACNVGHRRKATWLKERFAEGLTCKVLRSGKSDDIGMIEYSPGRHAWRPVEAEGYLVIHCLWIHGEHKGKGLGSRLLESCLDDARKRKCQGVAVVTSSDSFMAGSALFLKAGFVPVDRTIGGSEASAAPFELLVRKFRKTAPDPRFIVEEERLLKRYRKGLTILAADQCPYVVKSVERIAEAARTLGLEPKMVRVGSAQASRELPTPYGVFSIIFDGKLIAHRPISATRFVSIMRANAEQKRRAEVGRMTGAANSEATGRSLR